MKKTISVISLVLVLVILTACLVGCAPANENKAKAKLEKKGYTVEIMSGEEMNEMLQQYAGMPLNFGAKGMLSATKGMDEITAIWIESKEKAEDFVRDWKTENPGDRERPLYQVLWIDLADLFTGSHEGLEFEKETAKGGFTEEEVTQCKEQGAECLSLGKRILRTETAGLAMLSMLMLSIECSEE